MFTHAKSKPYTCQLDSCWKQFTQLGNLKVALPPASDYRSKANDKETVASE